VPRQVSARHPRLAADEVQRDAAVDLPGGFAGGYAEVREIDLAHLACATHTSRISFAP